MQSIDTQVSGYREKGRRHKKWKNLVTALACVVVFCTVYVLILPAITLEGNTYCGQEEHVHSDECYAQAVASTEKKLVCTLEEEEPHTHTDACYAQTAASEASAASAEGETSGDSAESVVDAAAVDASGETSDGSASSETTEPELICGKAETAGHSHGDSCYEEVVVYGEPELICLKEEHTHSLACYSNPTADVETAADWEKTFEDVTFTHDWVADTIAIAKTQLGYKESVDNYEVLEDGETKKGYTRYGEFYGNKYGDWCAMFVSFCLHYAEVDDFPLDAGCQNWIESLQKIDAENAAKQEGTTTLDTYKAYQEAAEDYIPSKGNLIFFNWDAEADSDHVGLIVDVTTDEYGTTTIKTIEGNTSDTVKYKEYDLDNSTIMGYGILPEQEFYCEMEGHVHDEDCYNDADELICTMEEHIHTDECQEQSELTEEEQAEVDAVIAAIDALPTADEFEAKLVEYEDADDMEGYQDYWVEIQNQGAEAYLMYEELSELQKSYVTNIDKLMDLEWLWSVATLNSSVTSDAPTTTWYTSTKDFVELNLYDYNSYINTNYWSTNTKYPGFQWNGGAYSKSDYQLAYSATGIGIPNIITDRNYIDSIDFGNSLITDYTYGGGSGGSYSKANNATNVAKSSYYYSTTSPINWIYGNSTEGYTNKPIGVSTTDASYSDVMSYTLNDDGYPQLANEISLEYLFTEGTAVDKLNTESIDGLFQRDEESGEYSYNSRTNHAQYSNNFFQLYDDIITPNFITYPFGNFLPLNTISDSSKATQVGAFNYAGGVKAYVERTITDLQNDTEGLGSYWTATQSQLITMLQEYKENWQQYPRTINGTSNNWDNLSAANAIRDYFWGDSDGDGDSPSADTSFITQEHLDQMYNIDWDVQTNFFIGMEMKMNFMMPKNGYTGNDKDGDGASDYPMVFEFTGDDDVWVYIDGVLFLDLSGIHRHVGGKIDFVNGKVYYYNLDVANGGDVSSTPYKTYTFKEILEAADKDTSVLNSNGTFVDYSTHAFNFYYTERGSGSSVCRLNFNFPLLKKNSISVTKENVPDEDTVLVGNPDYYFNIVTPGNELFVGHSSKTGVYEYTILDSGGNAIGTGETDEYGIFTLKAGQTAVFEGIKENEGKFFVQELIKGEDEDQYNKEVTVNGTASRHNKLIDWSHRTYFSDSDDDEDTGPYGYKWYGHSGQDTDSSTNSSFYFEAINGVKTSSLGKLSITKDVETYDAADPDDVTYKMYVILDRELIPVGTEYIVTDADGNETEKTVTEKGCIEIKAGETATISSILSGTEFTVSEDSDSAKGYTVIYDASGTQDEITSDGTGISGTIRNSATVLVTVTNTENGTTLKIPVQKTIAYPDGESHTFNFELQEVNADGTDLNPVGTKWEKSIEVTNSADFIFALNYFEKDYDTLPVKYYYKLIEAAGSGTDVKYDETEYLIEVTVSKGDDGLQAAITDVWVDGESLKTDGVLPADLDFGFTNILLQDLVIEKQLVGTSDSDGKYRFSVILKDENGTPLTGNYEVTAPNSDDTVTKTLDTNGKFEVEVEAGSSITIHGLPLGTSWSITELDVDGYWVTRTINTESTEGDEVEDKTASGILTEKTTVTYVNTTTYELPETGGIGTTPFRIGGMALILGVLLYNKKRRKEEMASS